jgi:flagellar basal body P-ring formation protein FlgA
LLFFWPQTADADHPSTCVAEERAVSSSSYRLRTADHGLLPILFLDCVTHSTKCLLCNPAAPRSGITLALLIPTSMTRRLAAIVKRFAPALLICMCVLFAGTASANIQALDTIQQAAEQFVRSHLPDAKAKHYVSAASLDSRLRLKQCDVPLEAFSNTSDIAARVTVGVRCTAAAPWTIYVPVTIEVEVPVLVLRRALARRARVMLTDVEPQVRRLPGSAANFITDIASLQGHRLKRALPAGTAITVDALTPDILVRRGQQVTLIAAVGGIEIRAQGNALTEGGAQDRVRVQNVTSLKVVEGVVESDSVVRVGL